MPLEPFGAQDQLEIASLGTEIALTEILGAAAGYWLDTKLGTLPWCLVGGVLIGFALGIVRIVAVARNANKKKNGRS
ncbi:MAG: AtpZ/AtpI family protein [Elusimicrobiaceae bacterium]|nr:AtpZ/AtpI family protein [Elusimicrobiaceae bacterium]